MYHYGTMIYDNPLQQLKQNILHVDMDAFYASLAERDNPKLKGLPVVMARHPNETGGTGIVSTANYKAREYGIHSGMSSLEAYKRAPNAIFVPVNHSYIRSVSRQLYEIFLSYSDQVQRIAYDEAYISLPMNVKGADIANDIQRRIRKELNLTCSIGVSYNKLMAKLASDYKKPNGITTIGTDEAEEFLDVLKVEDFHGIGPKTTERLHRIDVFTIKDVKNKDIEDIRKIFGSNTEKMIYRMKGIDPSPVKSKRRPKSSGNERTYHPFLESNKDVRDSIIELVDMLGDTLKDDSTYGTTVVLKIRDGEFTNYSRRISVNYLFNDKATLYELAWKAWLEIRGTILHSIRLIGVTLTGLDQQEDGGEGQMLLF